VRQGNWQKEKAQRVITFNNVYWFRAAFCSELCLNVFAMEWCGVIKAHICCMKLFSLAAAVEPMKNEGKNLKI